MSGHSHWKTIKFKKAAADIQKSKVASKLLNEVAASARAGGDPESNYRLRAAIEKAKDFKIGVDVIDRAVKRGAGLLQEAAPEEIYYEAYGPQGSAIVIKAITDNRNRAVNEVKNALTKYGAKFADSGSVKWLFEEKGVITVDKAAVSEPFLLELIEAGVENYTEQDGEIVLTMDYRNLGKVRDFLAQKNVAVSDASIDLVPKTPVQLQGDEAKRALDTLIEGLMELDSVDDVYTNCL